MREGVLTPARAGARKQGLADRSALGRMGVLSVPAGIHRRPQLSTAAILHVWPAPPPPQCLSHPQAPAKAGKGCHVHRAAAGQVRSVPTQV